MLEDAPNSSTLAEDLQRALEALQLNGRRRGGKEVILETNNGVRVEVEDCTAEEESKDGGREWTGTEEAIEDDQHEVWRAPSQARGSGSAPGTPGLGGVPGKAKMIPTARPPPSD